MSQFMTVPVYQQLADRLRNLITSGDYSIGDHFLAERDICERYGVSRITANKAISMLRMEGFLDMRPGKGVFVISTSGRYNLRELLSLTSMAARMDMKIETRVLEFSELDGLHAGDAVQEALFVGTGDLVYFVRRVRSLDGHPVHLDRRYLIARHCPGMTAEDVNGSLVGGLQERWGLNVGAVDQRIRAVVMNSDEAEALGRPEGEAGLALEAVGYLTSDEPLWYEESLFVSDRFYFSSRIDARGAEPVKRVYVEGEGEEYVGEA